MLFQKKATPGEPELAPSLEWADPSKPMQTLLVGVNQWNYKVFPSMIGERWGSWLFQFGGETTIGALKGIEVSGEIEVLEPDEELGMLSDHWQNVPKDIEGYGFLIRDKNDPCDIGSIGLTLYCKGEALDWLYRAFLCGLSSLQGAIGIHVNITYPDAMTPQFWKEDWRSKWWQVASWKVLAGVDRQKCGQEPGSGFDITTI